MCFVVHMAHKIRSADLTFIMKAGLILFIEFTTRGQNILDVIPSDDEQIINQVDWDPLIGS